MLAMLWLCALAALASHSVEDFGAIANVDTWKTATHNSDVLYKVLLEANSSADRTVVFPIGQTYYVANSTLLDLHNVQIVVLGTVRFSDEINSYPLTDGANTEGLWLFKNCVGIHITGPGTIDGQGLKWWRYAYTGTDHRPRMINFKVAKDIYISHLTLLNSPSWFLNFGDCRDILVHHVTIYTDPEVTRARGESVTYALNTDGIDLAAYNATVHHCNITNYDDAIVAKPCKGTGVYCTCAGNILAHDNTIAYSTGLTIGSVPPNDNVNCVRNVTFRDTTMYRPLKAIYIKSNPGDTGTGIIEDILYENIFIQGALWWTVWIGPQQQNQPGGDSGTGCNFLFPFVPLCPTQPRVSIRRITLRNVTAVDTLPLFEGPGVVLCDPLNPCTDIVFDRVVNSMYAGNVTDVIALLPVPVPGVLFPTDMRSDDWEFNYITSNVYGEERGTVPGVCMEKECFWVAPEL